jgi:DNA-3-methyladenine glycosylase I
VGDAIIRCSWAETNDLLQKYHDEEWGVPVHNDRHLFEMINLEGAQAGLSWLNSPYATGKLSCGF